MNIRDPPSHPFLRSLLGKVLRSLAGERVGAWVGIDTMSCSVWKVCAIRRSAVLNVCLGVFRLALMTWFIHVRGAVCISSEGQALLALQRGASAVCSLIVCLWRLVKWPITSSSERLRSYVSTAQRYMAH